MDNQQYSTWNSTQCCVAAWMGGETWGEWTHVYAWLSPFAHISELTGNVKILQGGCSLRAHPVFLGQGWL